MPVTLTWTPGSTSFAAPFITLASPLYTGALEFTFTLDYQTVAGDSLHLDIATDSGFASIVRSGDYTIAAADLAPLDAGIMPSFGFGLANAPDGLLYARVKQTHGGADTGYRSTSFTIAASVEMVSAPVLSAAIPKVGIGYTATAGLATGFPPISFTWQWKANGINATGLGATGSGATPPTYTPAVGDVGKTLTLTQTGSNAVPSSNSITSAASAVVISNTALTPVYIGGAGLHGDIAGPTYTHGPFTLGTPAAGRLIVAHIDTAPNVLTSVEIVGNVSTIAMVKRAEEGTAISTCAIYTAVDTVNTTASIRITTGGPGWQWAIVVQLATLPSGTFTSQQTDTTNPINPAITNPTDGVSFIAIAAALDQAAVSGSSMTIMDSRAIAPGGSMSATTYVFAYNNTAGAQTPIWTPSSNAHAAVVTISP